MTGVSLVDGWLYITVLVLGVVSFAYLLIRPFHWWWIWVVPPVLVVSAVAAWSIGHFVAPTTSARSSNRRSTCGSRSPSPAIGLAIGYMFSATWWQRVLAIIAAVLVVAAAGNQINNYYKQYPRFGDLLGVSSDQQIAGPPAISTGPASSSSTTPTRPAGPLTTTWTPTGSDIPADGKGRTSTIDLPGTASGFVAAARARCTTRPPTSPTTRSRCRC